MAFDKTMTIWNTAHTAAISVTAGTEGVKGGVLDLICPPYPPYTVTEEEAIDLFTAAIQQKLKDVNSPPPPNPAP